MANAGPPRIGQRVIFTERLGAFYPGLITALETNGCVRLTVFAPGAVPADFRNVLFDGRGIVPASWRYSSDVEQVSAAVTDPNDIYTDEDGTPYVTEDGSDFYVTEAA